MAGSEFDQAFDDADDELFQTFGEQGGGMYTSKDGGAPRSVGVVLQRNVGPAGAGGVFVAVELAADLRIKEVPDPQRGDQVLVNCRRYDLNEYMGSDGLINRFSLMPAD